MNLIFHCLIVNILLITIHLKCIDVRNVLHILLRIFHCNGLFVHFLLLYEHTQTQTPSCSRSCCFVCTVIRCFGVRKLCTIILQYNTFHVKRVYCQSICMANSSSQCLQPFHFDEISFSFALCRFLLDVNFLCFLH